MSTTIYKFQKVYKNYQTKMYIKKLVKQNKKFEIYIYIYIYIYISVKNL